MKAILFDLDGTLLPMDIDQFMKLYFHEMGNSFEGLLSREALVDKVMKATGVMIHDLSERTNEEVFMSTFEAVIDGDLSVHQERFDAFYETGYKKVQASSKMSPSAIEAVKILKSKGYILALVTNPLFPKDAIEQRIHWAGLKVEDFDYITSFENNHYCKPHLHLYEEVIASLGLEAKDCLMVGNDVQEDLIVSEIGMKTFLIEDHMINRTDAPINATYRGGYEDFLKFVREEL